MFCLMIKYDNQQRSEFPPLIFRRSYTFGIKDLFKNDLKFIAKKSKNIEAKS